jgi:hypothetical protein
MACPDVLSGGDMTYTMTGYGQTVTVTLGMYGDPILVDGSQIGHQREGDTEDCMRLVAHHCWGEHFDWDDIAYEAI